MPIPPEHIRERLSVAYVSAVVANAGYSLWNGPSTEYGTDGMIQKIRKLPNGKYHATGDGVMLQIKGTINSEIRGSEIVYNMKVDAYNKLVDWEGDMPCILVLMCLPRQPSHWAHHSEDMLSIKRCCYWKHIEEPKTLNNSNKTIYIPRAQQFTTQAVDYIFENHRKFRKVAA